MTASSHPLLRRRTSGVLLHLTSLPGPHGHGDLGVGALYFLDWLASARQGLWQILPLTPPGPGHSPYSSPSAFAGNPWLVDLQEMVRQGWLAELPSPGWNPRQAYFVRVIPWRLNALWAAWMGFCDRGTREQHDQMEQFAQENAYWLLDYARFMVLHQRHGAPWTAWPAPIVRREREALSEFDSEAQLPIRFWQFVQWRFDVQWQRLRREAQARGVRIVGDVPIFVSHHSADVWAHPHLFKLDILGNCGVVAGVPPDYFSPTGQRWGNPLYDWAAMAREGHAWWIQRVAHHLRWVDMLRLDHFRGFQAAWEIPAGMPDATQGDWRAGPGRGFFQALERALGPLPVIAEDLGMIGPDVERLRRDCALPGMRILQFAFGDNHRNPYLPHNYEPATVAYTGTHDNDTAFGWWHSATVDERAAARDYLGPDVEAEPHWAMIRALSQSVANTLVVPFQDLLGLDSQHRMNRPGQAEGCWAWRFEWAQVDGVPAERLGAITRSHGRNFSD